MKILLTPFNWFHQSIAGGEVYLHRLSQHLISKGHEVKCIAGCKEPYSYFGIDITPQGEMAEMFITNNDLFKWCEVIITQLLGTSYGCNKAQQHNKPLIFISHNNAKSYPVKWQPMNRTHIIYNSYQLRDDLQTTLGQFNSFVLHPVMPELPRSSGKKVTLINCNYNKGGHILAELAGLLPNIQFQGVLGGYGEQIKCNLPNVTYLPNGCDMTGALADTGILIVPSEFESFSQAATEALHCGIPVIAHPTTGLKENLADAGIFIDRKDVNKYKETIVYLMNDHNRRPQSEKMLARSKDLRNKQSAELDRFDNWLSKIR